MIRASGLYLGRGGIYTWLCEVGLVALVLGEFGCIAWCRWFDRYWEVNTHGHGVYVCMYVCMCIYIGMYVCTYVYIYIKFGMCATYVGQLDTCAWI